METEMNDCFEGREDEYGDWAEDLPEDDK